MHSEHESPQKEESPHKDIFTDPESPWAKAIQPVKDLFTKDEKNLLKLNEIQFPFQERPTETNYCTHIFKAVQQYFTCSDCCYNTSLTTMCYCNDCWIVEKHEGHSYRRQKNNFYGKAYCDCGREERMEKNSFCSRHSHRQITIEMDPDEKTSFQTYISSLYEIYFYLLNNNKKATNKIRKQILTKMHEFLKNITDGSGYYSRMILEVWEKQIKVDDQTLSIFQYLSRENMIQDITFNMMTDFYCIVEMAKAYLKFQSNATHDGLKHLKEEFMKEEVFAQLAKNDIFFVQKEEEYAKMAKKTSQGASIFMKYLEKTEKNKLSMATILAGNFNSDDQTILSNKEFENFMLSKSFSLTKEMPTDDEEQLKNPFTQLQFLINNILFRKANGDLALLADLKNFAKENQIQQQTLLNHIQGCMKNGKQCFFSQRKNKPLQIGLMMPFLMIRQLEDKEKYIDLFWKSLYEDKGNRLIQMLDISYQVMAFICHYELAIFLRKASQESQYKNQPKIEEFFRSFLFEKKKISKDVIWDMKTEKQLSYPSAGKILNQLCTYNQETEEFIYVSKEKYENNLIWINYRHRLGNVRDIKQTKINYNTNIQIKDPFQREMLELVFMKPLYFPKVNQLWERLLKDTEDNAPKQQRLKGFQIGRLYLINMVLINKMLQGRNQELANQLTKLREDPDFRFSLCYLAEQSNIMELLALNVQQQKVEENAEQIQEVKKKAQEKKQKLLSKFKQKQGLVLEKNLSKMSNQGDQEVDLCLLCHQAAKKNRQLVYLSSVNKNQTLCCSIYGPYNKANTLIQTCFHTIHVDCFIKMDKHVVAFNCPLCQKKGNCIFPVNFDPNDKKLNKICSNVINASLMIQYKIYDNDSNFILLFKHLLESKGLNSLISFARYEQEKAQRGKVDDFILGLLQEIYRNATTEQQEGFDNGIHQLLNEVKECPKIYALIQQILIKALHSRLSLPIAEIDMDILIEIKRLAREEEFLIIKNQLQELSQESIEFPQHQQEMGEEKITVSFNIIRPPACSSDIVKFGKDTCDVCGKVNRFLICLLCQTTICRTCDRKKHQDQKHNGNWLFFLPSDAVIVRESKEEQEITDLYLNDFRMPYKMKKSLGKNQVFNLSESALLKAINKFLQIS